MRSFTFSLAGWAAAFAVLSVPLFAWFPTAIPAVPNASDSQLIVWILDWVLHSLSEPVRGWTDAPINHPAPGQLTGSDWFLSAQLAFAPAFLVSGNAILATNIAAWTTYPLSAAITQHLLRRLGFTLAAALPAALFFSLASRRVPFNIHQLQNANLLLPLVALALVHLREEPGWRRSALAAAAFLLAVLSALYGALFSGLVGAIFLVTLGFSGAAQKRPRFFLFALAAAALTAALSAWLLGDWWARTGSEMRPLVAWEASPEKFADALLGASRHEPTANGFWVPAVVVLPALYATWRAGSATIAITAAILWLSGALLSLGLPSVFEQTPLAFMAYPPRFQVVADLGRALVLALGITGMGLALRQRNAERLASGVVVLALLATRALSFAETPFLLPAAVASNAPVYERFAELGLESPGPVLELPLRTAARETRGRPVAPDAMLGQMRHRQPLLNGYTGYHAAHRAFLLDAIGRLPSALAIDDLQRATGVRWILLRPEKDWRGHQPPRSVVRAALLQNRAVAATEDIDGWTLIRLRPREAGEDWAAQIAAAPQGGSTALGYPSLDLRGQAISGRIATTSLPAKPPPAPGFVRFRVRVENHGSAAWPASRAPSRATMLDFGTEQPRGPFQKGLLQRATPFPVEGEVVLVARWLPVRTRQAPPDPLVIPLPRDLPPGESVEFWTLLWKPKVPGPYELELSLAQVHERVPIDLGLDPYSQSVRISSPNR